MHGRGTPPAIDAFLDVRRNTVLAVLLRESPAELARAKDEQLRVVKAVAVLGSQLVGNLGRTNCNRLYSPG
jgi:hypothetical protein